MPVTFAQLMQLKTAEQVRARILAVLGVAGFQVTAWGPFSFQLRVVNGVSSVLADLYTFASENAKGGYGETAEGAWQDLWGQDRYQLEKNPARRLTGVMVATDHGGGPHTGVAAGGIVITDDAGLVWTSTSTVTIPLDGSANVPVEAADDGALYNIPNDATNLRLVSDLPTVTISNPAQSGTETWITTAGADLEEPEAFYARCIARWSELSVASPGLAYASRIMREIPTVTKVGIRDQNPLGPGSMELILATGAGPASGADVTAANSLLLTVRPVGGGLLRARAAVARTVHVGGVAYVAAASRAGAMLGAALQLTSLQSALQPGGTIYAAETIRIIQSQAGVRNFVPTSLVDTTVGEDEVITISMDVTFVAE